MGTITADLETIRSRIAAAARAAGREPSVVTLIAVSKTKPEADVRAAYAAGQKVFGENRVQEAKTKYEPLRTEFPDLKLHLIGPLQTNKAEEAVRLFDVIETLDREKLAEALAAAIAKTGCKPKLYIEVNIGSEPQKAGIAPAALKGFLRFCREKCGLEISGLMCIPPHTDHPDPHFARMKELAAHVGLHDLSMGMSADFEAAIRAGATHVRVGSAIFGERG